MKYEAPQFPLPLDLPQAQPAPSAPLVLEPETARQAPMAQDLQPDLLQAPPQPPARDLAGWISRQPNKARAKLRRAALRITDPHLAQAFDLLAEQ